MKLHPESKTPLSPLVAIHAKLWPFDHDTVYDAPETSGVFALWRYGEVIFYGRANSPDSTVRTCLAEHLAGLRGLTRSASHCSWEICTNPALRERELIADFFAMFRRLPSCNDHHGAWVIVRDKITRVPPHA